MAIYLTPDGEHAVVGTLMDHEGNDLTEAQLDQHVRAPLEAQTWQLLGESHWIQDGHVARSLGVLLRARSGIARS